MFELKAASEAVGLHVNDKKTKYMLENQTSDDLTTQQRNRLKVVGTLKYLVSSIQSIQKDMEVRIGQASYALNKMDRRWR